MNQRGFAKIQYRMERKTLLAASNCGAHSFFFSLSSLFLFKFIKEAGILCFSFEANHWMMRLLLISLMNLTSFAVSSPMDSNNIHRIKCDKKKDVMKLNYHIFHSNQMVRIYFPLDLTVLMQKYKEK